MRLTFFILFLIVTTTSIGQTIEVCSSCNVTSIKQAIQDAQEGSSILVKKGVYQENDIIIDKKLTLKAEKGAIIDGQEKGEIIMVTADGVTIDGFEIINVGTSNLRDYTAIRIKESNNFVVQNNTIKQPFFAIYLEKSSNGIVKNNHISGKATSEFTAGNGIHLWYSHNNLIEDNYTSKMRDGIYCEFSDENVMTGNIVEYNVRYGLHFMFCHKNNVYDNTYRTNGAGIAIMFSKNVELHHNIITDNWGGTAYGVLLKECYDTEIHHNVFRRNTTAINVEGSSRANYSHNDFESNGWAIQSRGANYDNNFKDNNFINNSFDLAYKGTINRNSFNGNYWSDYSGYDLDRDGIGDVPYRPIKLFSHIVNRSPGAIILLRSIFIDIVNFSERVSPVFTPENVLDETPRVKMIKHD